MERPPRVIEGTVRKPQPDINVPMWQDEPRIIAGTLPTPTLGDPLASSLVLSEFNVLFKPSSSIPHTIVANPSQESADTVLDSLNYNMRLTAAQLINVESRRQASELDGPDRPPPVTMRIIENDRKILVQNTIATIVITSILTVIARAHGWGLVSTWKMSNSGSEMQQRGLIDFGMKERVPDSALSIASMASLLKESNMMAVLSQSKCFGCRPRKRNRSWRLCCRGCAGLETSPGSRSISLLLSLAR